MIFPNQQPISQPITTPNSTPSNIPPLPAKKQIVNNLVANAKPVDPYAGYKKATLTYYDPTDPKQTRPDTDGTGAYGKKMQFGDVAVGNRSKYKKGDVLEIPKFKDTDTPYGKGIFKVYDVMNKSFNEPNNDYIDVAIPRMYKGADVGMNYADADAMEKKVNKQQIQFKINNPMKPTPALGNSMSTNTAQTSVASSQPDLKTKKRGVLGSMVNSLKQALSGSGQVALGDKK